jgi:hypothetical protein
MKTLLFSSLFLLFFTLAFPQNDRTQVLQDLENQQVAVQDTGLTATLKSASRLFRDKDDLTSVIIVIPADSVVSVLDADSVYYHVVYEDLAGYIYASQASINRPVRVTKPALASDQQAQVQARTGVPVQEGQSANQGDQSRTVDRYSYLVGKYGVSIGSRLYDGKIWRGMTSEMVQDSWGSPRKINRLISGDNLKEEWIYSRYWLFFRNSMLTDWGKTR